MRALVLEQQPRLAERPTPEPGPDEALVRVRVAGVCATDLQLVRGYMAYEGVLGHEFVGEVVACPSAPARVGERVNGEINLGCGGCPACARGMARHCPTRRVLGILNKDGCFAEYLTLPVTNLVTVPETVSDEAAAFTEPLAAAFEILEQLHIAPGERVLVLGDGRLGLLIGFVLAQTGCELHHLGRHRDKLALAEAAGAQVWLDSASLQGRFDVVVEATGRPEGLGAAMGRVRPRGTLVLKSTYHGATQVDLAPLVIDEVRLLGSRCGPFPAALRALAAGRVDPRPLIQAELPLADAEQALARAGEPGVLKVLLRP